MSELEVVSWSSVPTLSRKGDHSSPGMRLVVMANLDHGIVAVQVGGYNPAIMDAAGVDILIDNLLSAKAELR